MIIHATIFFFLRGPCYHFSVPIRLYRHAMPMTRQYAGSGATCEIDWRYLRLQSGRGRRRPSSAMSAEILWPVRFLSPSSRACRIGSRAALPVLIRGVVASLGLPRMVNRAVVLLLLREPLADRYALFGTTRGFLLLWSVAVRTIRDKFHPAANWLILILYLVSPPIFFKKSYYLEVLNKIYLKIFLHGLSLFIKFNEPN